MSSMNRDRHDKREHILAAARECFLLYGFRRTSMDDIAQCAGVSRAAVYLLFPNKEAIFRTLSEQIHDAAIVRAEVALQGEGSIERRLIAAFEGKHMELLELIQNKVHGAELVDLDRGIGADIAQRAEHRFRQALTQALRQAEERGEIALSQLGIDAEQCAELLILAARGVKSAASDMDLYQQRLTQLIWVFCAAMTRAPAIRM